MRVAVQQAHRGAGGDGHDRLGVVGSQRRVLLRDAAEELLDRIDAAAAVLAVAWATDPAFRKTNAASLLFDAYHHLDRQTAAEVFGFEVLADFAPRNLGKANASQPAEELRPQIGDWLFGTRRKPTS